MRRDNRDIWRHHTSALPLPFNEGVTVTRVSEWMTYAEAARMVGVTWSAVQNRVRKGKMSVWDKPDRKFVCLADVMAWRGERKARGRAMITSGVVRRVKQ